MHSKIRISVYETACVWEEASVHWDTYPGASVSVEPREGTPNSPPEEKVALKEIWFEITHLSQSYPVSPFTLRFWRRRRNLLTLMLVCSRCCCGLEYQMRISYHSRYAKWIKNPSLTLSFTGLRDIADVLKESSMVSWMSNGIRYVLVFWKMAGHNEINVQSVVCSLLYAGSKRLKWTSSLVFSRKSEYRCWARRTFWEEVLFWNLKKSSFCIAFTSIPRLEIVMTQQVH